MSRVEQQPPIFQDLDQRSRLMPASPRTPGAAPPRTHETERPILLRLPSQAIHRVFSRASKTIWMKTWTRTPRTITTSCRRPAPLVVASRTTLHELARLAQINGATINATLHAHPIFNPNVVFSIISLVLQDYSSLEIVIRRFETMAPWEGMMRDLPNTGGVSSSGRRGGVYSGMDSTRLVIWPSARRVTMNWPGWTWPAERMSERSSRRKVRL